MKDVREKLEETGIVLDELCPNFPKIVIVLGSGLAELLSKLKVEKEIPFSALPHFQKSTVEGHVGRLVVGELDGVRVGCMQGRLHFYEGYSMGDVVFPYRLFAAAGAEAFLLTNAAGGIHADMRPCDFMLIRDHINLMGSNPLIGPNVESLGVRFPDMSDAYDPTFRQIARDTAQRLGIPLREGVYVGIHGPSYETPAEIRMYRALGADAVGMSTVPETIAIRHMGKRVLGISFITNLAAGVGTQKLEHAEVLENAKKGYASFSRLVGEIVREMNGEI